MTTYNMYEAKTNLSKICRMISSGEEDYVIIASNGTPVAKIVPYVKNTSKRIGILKGKYKFSEHFDDHNEEIEKMFLGD